MSPSSNRRRVAIILILATASVAFAAVLTSRRPRDFAVYMLAAERIVQGEQIYRPDHPPAFTYPPFFALPYVTLLPFPPQLQLFLWSLINCGLLIATIGIVASWIRPQMRENHVAHTGSVGAPHHRESAMKKARWAWLVIGLLTARFLVSPLEYQAHDLIVLVLILFGGKAIAVGRHAIAGSWIGLAAACKATPLLFLPVFAEQRRWRACNALVSILIIATLLPDMIFPSRDGQPWVFAWYDNFVSKVNVGASPEVDGAWARWDILNQSLSGTFFRLATPLESAPQFDVCLWQLNDSQLRLATLVAYGVILSIIAVALWPRKKTRWADGDRSFLAMGQVGVVLCGMLLLSPMSSKHHFCALIVPIAFCVVYCFYRRRDALVIAGLLTVFLLGTLGAKDLVGDYIGNRLQAFGSLAICALACLVATSWALFRGPMDRNAGQVVGSDTFENAYQPPLRPEFDIADAA